MQTKPATKIILWILSALVTIGLFYIDCDPKPPLTVKVIFVDYAWVFGIYAVLVYWILRGIRSMINNLVS